MRRDQRNQAALVMPHLIVSHEIPNASSYNKDRYRDVPRRTPVAYPIRQSEDSSEEPHSFTESDEDVRFSSSTTITPY